ncbi:putative membrane protein, putative virulence factor [Cryptosporangium arvum DSM 44712]|uniref:Putative membrane protein, putative virulence factor n=1 Tax=Cryptosporangium arvum DSM 44712 TaxID=927661 RepID=A0A010YME2_9ACTN|nr:putative membrane protein, putative virulence factor [Cryptosporangium arvum DSM 44712]
MPDTAAAPDDTGSPPPRARRTRTLLGAAGLIAGLTVVARIVGFGRIFVFAGAVGVTSVGNIYQAVNTIPNIVFEIVAGGALAAVVVPLLAGAADRGDRATVDRITSALLTWAVLLLAPLAVVIAVAAGPIVDALLPGASAADGEFGRLLLRIFAPQLVLYGVGIVLTGVLQAHRRFAGPALAPLLSSVTVIAAYLVYGWTEGGAATASDVGLGGQLVLAVGTTLGVVVLSLSLLLPLRGTGVRIRPTLRFPAGVVGPARRMVGSGVATVAGQQVALLVVLVLTQESRSAPVGSLVVFTMAQTVFLLPWAVFAVPLATSAYPRLASAWEGSDRAGYRDTLRTTLHGTLVLCALATAALIAGAGPIAAVVTAAGNADAGRAAVATGIALFAPGLLGYGLFALLSRALYAAGRPWPVATAVLGGWAVTAVADVVLAFALPAGDRVAALAAGNTIGMTVLGVALLVLTARTAGTGAFRGLGRLAAALVPATVLAATAGAWVASVLPGAGVFAALGAGVVTAIVVAGLFLAVLRPVGRLVGAETGIPLRRPRRVVSDRPGMLDPIVDEGEKA